MMEYRCGNTRVNVEKVCKIAREAGAAIMEVYNSDLEVIRADLTHPTNLLIFTLPCRKSIVMGCTSQNQGQFSFDEG